MLAVIKIQQQGKCIIGAAEAGKENKWMVMALLPAFGLSEALKLGSRSGHVCICTGNRQNGCGAKSNKKKRILAKVVTLV